MLVEVEREVGVEAGNNMDYKYTRISLKFWHPIWKSKVFSDALDLSPRFTHTVGEPRTTPTGVLLDGLYTRSYWCYNYKSGDNCDPAEAIDQLIGEISSRADFLRSITDSGGKSEISVRIVSPIDFGEEFPSELLLKLGQLGIGLSFDIYLGDPDKP